MSKKLFSNKDIELLSKNKQVKKVSEKGITYTDELKKWSYVNILDIKSQTFLCYTSS